MLLKILQKVLVRLQGLTRSLEHKLPTYPSCYATGLLILFVNSLLND